MAEDRLMDLVSAGTFGPAIAASTDLGKY